MFLCRWPKSYYGHDVVFHLYWLDNVMQPSVPRSWVDQHGLACCCFVNHGLLLCMDPLMTSPDVLLPQKLERIDLSSRQTLSQNELNMNWMWPLGISGSCRDRVGVGEYWKVLEKDLVSRYLPGIWLMWLRKPPKKYSIRMAGKWYLSQDLPIARPTRCYDTTRNEYHSG